MSIFTQIRETTTSMYIKEHEIKYLVKHDILDDKKNKIQIVIHTNRTNGCYSYREMY